MLSGNEIRQQFIDFFVEKHKHTFVASSSVVPLDDPTLMFANAGMNQFKDVFLATGTRDYTRAVNTQKCIRAGGKHNDLDDVGKDTYHHTFFEMLGNWSFGDYFKKEAIEWAWQLLTDVWKIDKTRLHATVFEGDASQGLDPDEEAADLWRTVTDIDHKNIHYGNKKDNFWEMGDTGPCGPCTEIHIDLTPDKSGAHLVNAGVPEVIEIWNLVFIQFNRGEDGNLTPLPAKHVDTGMGFERIAAVLQGKTSNYDTDIWSSIFEAIQKLTGADQYTGDMEDHKDTAYRVIADHIRTLTFSLTDGAIPSNTGRGYVLRRILRRAERYGRQYLGTTKPFLVDLVPTVVEHMGDAFPELKRDPKKVQNIIRDEEESFLRTLDRGMKIFNEACDRAEGGVLSGDDAFLLHGTYGVYIDIVEQMASERGLNVDRVGYEERLREEKDRARGARKKIVITAVDGDLPTTDDSPKYSNAPVEGTVLGWVKDNKVINEGTLEPGNEVALLLDRTNCYGEQGGQVGDFEATVIGKTGAFEVQDTQRLGETILHIGSLQEGKLEVGEKVQVELSNTLRADTMRNHTSTHLLNWALRKVLGDHIDQKGSLVDPDKTRFDFSHDSPLTHQEIKEIERLVNEKIYADLPVKGITMPLDDAQKLPGVRAVFGEKYPDPVRVLMIGSDEVSDISEEDSAEFCGGTHLQHTGQAGFFKIVSQESVAKGVRRVTAVTGRTAVQAVQQLSSVVDELTSRMNCKPEDIPARVEALQDEIKKLQTQLKKGAAVDLQGAADKLLESASESNGAKIIIGEMPSGPVEQMRNQIDRLKQKADSAVIVVGWKDEDKANLIASVSKDLIAKGIKAGDIVKEVAKVVGGGGGGPPHLAQAGGKDPEKLPEALQKAKELVAEKMG
ncbi:MAG: alanine--tRNA ligase [Gemmataceae bacterium]